MARLSTSGLIKLEARLKTSIEESIIEISSEFDSTFRIGNLVAYIFDKTELTNHLHKSKQNSAAVVTLYFSGDLSGLIMLDLNQNSVEQISDLYSLDRSDPEYMAIRMDAIKEFGNVFLNRVCGNFTNQFPAKITVSEIRYTEISYKHQLEHFNTLILEEILWSSFNFKIDSQKISGRVALLLETSKSQILSAYTQDTAA